MKSITAICGALLGLALLLHLQPSEALRCYSCAHIKANGKDIGDPACLHGASKFLVECNDQTEIPSPVPGQRITLGDIRRQHGGIVGNTKTYSCAATTVNAKIQGVTVDLLMRQCSFGDPQKRSECKSGTKQEWDKVKDVPAGSFAGLNNDATIKACTCYSDQCKPSEIGGGGGPTGRSGGGGGGGSTRWRSARGWFWNNK